MYTCIFPPLPKVLGSSSHSTMSTASTLLRPFLGGLQASISVLLIILYGVIAAQFDLLNGDAAKQVSRICVRMFLPALLITNVGSELHLDTALRYVPVVSKPAVPAQKFYED